MDTDAGTPRDEAVAEFVQEDAREQTDDEQEAEEHASDTCARFDPPHVRKPENDERE